MTPGFAAASTISTSVLFSQTKHSFIFDGGAGCTPLLPGFGSLRVTRNGIGPTFRPSN